jgi:hypothetical protein
MSYQVKFMKGGLEVGSTPMGGPIQKAIHFAVAQLPIKATLIGATSVQVVEIDSQAVVFTRELE